DPGDHRAQRQIRLHAPHQANSDPAARLRTPRPPPGSYPVKRPALATNGSELIALSIRKKEVRVRGWVVMTFWPTPTEDCNLNSYADFCITQISPKYGPN